MGPRRLLQLWERRKHMRMQALLDELCDTTPKYFDDLCEQLGQDDDLSGLHWDDILDDYWMTSHFYPLWALYGEFLKLFPSAVCPAAAAELDVMLGVVLGAISARTASSPPSSPALPLAPSSLSLIHISEPTRPY